MLPGEGAWLIQTQRIRREARRAGSCPPESHRRQNLRRPSHHPQDHCRVDYLSCHMDLSPDPSPGLRCLQCINQQLQLTPRKGESSG